MVQGPEQRKAVKIFDSRAFVTQEQRQHRGSLEGRISRRKDWAWQLSGVFYFKSVDL